eukprot:scaffold3740_cov322-Prasinococcus_capsulatus_cf.AAC.11
MAFTVSLTDGYVVLYVVLFVFFFLAILGYLARHGFPGGFCKAAIATGGLPTPRPHLTSLDSTPSLASEQLA